jgi:hypothetical protein
MKIINLKTGMKREIPMFTCTICDCTFSEQEGGLQQGVIGMIPISFCPTCFSGIFSMVDYFKGEDIE